MTLTKKAAYVVGFIHTDRRLSVNYALNTHTQKALPQEQKAHIECSVGWFNALNRASLKHLFAIKDSKYKTTWLLIYIFMKDWHTGHSNWLLVVKAILRQNDVGQITKKWCWLEFGRLYNICVVYFSGQNFIIMGNV